jgi:hypothetical protein
MYREALDALGGNPNLGENLEKQTLLLREIEKLREIQKIKETARQAIADTLEQHKTTARQPTTPKRQATKKSTHSANEKVEAFTDATEKINAAPEKQKLLEILKNHMQSALREQKKAMELARRTENIAHIDKNAETHLSEALKLLGGAQEQKSKGENKNSDKNKDNANQSPKNEKENKNKSQTEETNKKDSTASQSNQQEEKARRQAANKSKGKAENLKDNGENAVLRQLLENEESLRDAIKMHQMRGAESSEKNW